jgi:hypothetical protein
MYVQTFPSLLQLYMTQPTNETSDMAGCISVSFIAINETEE